MAIQKIRASRVNDITADEFLGTLGLIWFNSDVGDLRIYDGNVGGRLLSTGGGGNPIQIDYNGNLVTTQATLIDFVGNGVIVSGAGGVITVDIPGGGGTANISVSNQSIPVTSNVASFNFIGSGVVTTAIGEAVTVDVPGAGYISFDGGSPFNYYGGGPAFDCGGVY
jgi:hypothetical protein